MGIGEHGLGTGAIIGIVVAVTLAITIPSIVVAVVLSTHGESGDGGSSKIGSVELIVSPNPSYIDDEITTSVRVTNNKSDMMLITGGISKMYSTENGQLIGSYILTTSDGTPFFNIATSIPPGQTVTVSSWTSAGTAPYLGTFRLEIVIDTNYGSLENHLLVTCL